MVDPNEGVDYSRHVVRIVMSDEFDHWLRKLKVRAGKLRILQRRDTDKDTQWAAAWQDEDESR